MHINTQRNCAVVTYYDSQNTSLFLTKVTFSYIPLLALNMSENTNPGNFSNRPHQEVENIVSKGGQSSHEGGFPSMDARKQVSARPGPMLSDYDHILILP